ncbi:hypothetical protein [Streptomyces californicus]
MRPVSADHRLARTRLILSAALGALRRSRVHQVERVRDLVPGTDAGSVAYDGEATPAPSHLALTKEGLICLYSP